MDSPPARKPPPPQPHGSQHPHLSGPGALAATPRTFWAHPGPTSLSRALAATGPVSLSPRKKALQRGSCPKRSTHTCNPPPTPPRRLQRHRCHAKGPVLQITGALGAAGPLQSDPPESSPWPDPAHGQHGLQEPVHLAEGHWLELIPGLWESSHLTWARAQGVAWLPTPGLSSTTSMCPGLNSRVPGRWPCHTGPRARARVTSAADCIRGPRGHCRGRDPHVVWGCFQPLSTRCEGLPGP